MYKPIFIAGPCVIETFDILEEVAKELVRLNNKYGINIIVHGDDWCGMSYLEQIRLTPEFIQEHQIQLIYLPYTKGISTSEIISQIQQSSCFTGI